MLTLKNPEIVVNLSQSDSAFDFAREMMKRAVGVCAEGWYSNDAGQKAMTFYSMAEFVRKCYDKGLGSVRIVQDDNAMDPCSWSGVKTSPYYWSISFDFDADSGVIKVSKRLMEHIIKN
jgi:hypothetical protein